MAKIIPWGENILIKTTAIGERKVGLVIVAASSSEQTSTAVIEAFGPKCQTELKIGDRVFFSAFNGTHVDMKTYGFADDAYRLIREEEILGLVKEE